MISASLSDTRALRRAATLAPYALISLYFSLVFATYGLHGGDLGNTMCKTANGDRGTDPGACPWFAGPLHDHPWQGAVVRYKVWSSRFTVELTEHALSHTLWLFVLITFTLAWLFIWGVLFLLGRCAWRALLQPPVNAA